MKKLFIAALCSILMFGCSATNQSQEKSSDTTKNASISDNQSTNSPTSPTTTPTPMPSNTPLVLPDPITYTGSGDDVIQIDTFEDTPWYLHIEGNKSSRHFAIVGYDESDNRTELFVNTTSVYSGDVIDPNLVTSALEISANGDWSVTVMPILSLPKYNVGDTVEGTGDSVVVLESASGTISAINKGESNFVVREYSSSGSNLLINEIGNYEGKVKSNKNAFLLEILSSGDWTITINE